MSEWRSEILVVHGSSLQDRDSSSSGQATPPPEGGVTTVRVRVCVPPPQAAEQSLHSLHSLTIQSTGVLHVLIGLAVFLGKGEAAEKSVELLSLSVHPLPALKIALVLEGAGVGPLPSKQLTVVPKPTKSITPVVGQEPLRATVLLTRATLPAVAAIAIVPMASGVGNEVVPPAPIACWMR